MGAGAGMAVKDVERWQLPLGGGGGGDGGSSWFKVRV